MAYDLSHYMKHEKKEHLVAINTDMKKTFNIYIYIYDRMELYNTI